MKKTKLLPIILLLLTGITSCDNSSNSLSSVNSSESSETSLSSEEEVQSITMMMAFDYGFHLEDKASLLISWSLLFFNPLDYGISELIAGDVVTVTYYGELWILESYPSTVNTDKMEIINVEVAEAIIVPYEIKNVTGGGTFPWTSNEDYQRDITFATENVVAEDYTFKHWEEYPARTIIYGTVPTSGRTNEIIAFYDYNPRP